MASEEPQIAAFNAAIGNLKASIHQSAAGVILALLIAGVGGLWAIQTSLRGDIADVSTKIDNARNELDAKIDSARNELDEKIEAGSERALLNVEEILARYLDKNPTITEAPVTANAHRSKQGKPLPTPPNSPAPSNPRPERETSGASN